MQCRTLCGELLHSDSEAGRNHIRSYAGVQREWVSKMLGTNKSGLKVWRITEVSWVRTACATSSSRLRNLRHIALVLGRRSRNLVQPRRWGCGLFSVREICEAQHSSWCCSEQYLTSLFRCLAT